MRRSDEKIMDEIVQEFDKDLSVLQESQREATMETGRGKQKTTFKKKSKTKSESMIMHNYVAANKIREQRKHHDY